MDSSREEKLRPIAGHLMSYCQSHLGFKDPPRLFFANDEQNATHDLGKTAYYDPAKKSVTVFITGRHNKDVLRSIAHELVHHMQNLRGDFNGDIDTSPDYAQKDPNMRNIEAEAYLLGNLLFRDWEDGIKTNKLKTNIVIKEEKNKMNKDLIKQLIKKRLLEMLQNEEAVEEGKASRAYRKGYKDGKKGHTKNDNDPQYLVGYKDGSEEETKDGEARAKAGTLFEKGEDIEEGAHDPFNEFPRGPTYAELTRDRDEAEFRKQEKARRDKEHAERIAKQKDARAMKDAIRRDRLGIGPERSQAVKEGEKEDIDENDCGKRDDDEKMEEGEIPQGLKDYMAKKNKDKPAEKEDTQEEGKMPLKPEPKGKDLNKDGKKGHGKVPAFLEEKEEDLRIPENENALNESRFGDRRDSLYSRLIKEWIK